MVFHAAGLEGGAMRNRMASKKSLCNQGDGMVSAN